MDNQTPLTTLSPPTPPPAALTSITSITSTLLSPTPLVIIITLYATLLITLLLTSYISDRRQRLRNTSSRLNVLFSSACQWLLCLVVGLGLGFPLAVVLVWGVELLGRRYASLIGVAWRPAAVGVLVGCVGLGVMCCAWMVWEGMRRADELQTRSEQRARTVNEDEDVDVEKGAVFVEQLCEKREEQA